MISKLQYPIGKFHRPTTDLSPNQRTVYIDTIEKAPEKFAERVTSLSEAQLDTPYRPEGWTIRQVVHHMADSHMNSFIRFKLALTEHNPVIKPYEEEKWAETPEIKVVPVSVSLQLLDSLHIRWVVLLKSLEPEDFKRTFHHPVSGSMTLDEALALYAWHSKHHLAHILNLVRRNNWSRS